MTDLEVDISARANKPLDQTIDGLCQAQGLLNTMKTTSSKYPGSIHWHFKKGHERGTLEVTLWPVQNRLWFSMQDGRKADWVMNVARELKYQLESGKKP